MADAKLNITTNGIEDAISKLTSLQNVIGIGLAAAAVAAAAGLVSAVKSVIDYGDKLNDMATKTGASVEALSSLKLAAETNGTTLDSVAQGFKYLNMHVADSANVFSMYGIEIAKTSDGNVDSTQTFLNVADAINKTKDQTEKVDIAVKVFGRSGAELIPMLSEGRAGLQAWMEKAKSLGLVMSTEAASASDKFNDSMTVLAGTTKGLMIQAVIPILPAISALVQSFADAKENSKLLSLAGEALVITFKAVVTAFIAAGTLIMAVGNSFINFVTLIKDLVAIGPEKAFEKFNASMADIDIQTNKNITTMHGLWDETYKSKSATDDHSTATKSFKDALGGVVDTAEEYGKRMKEDLIQRHGEAIEEATKSYDAYKKFKEELSRGGETAEEYGQRMAVVLMIQQGGIDSAEEYGKRMAELAHKAFPDATMSAEEYGIAQAKISEHQINATKQTMTLGGSMNHMTQQINNMTVRAFTDLARGIGDAVAQAIVLHRSFSGAMKDVLKQIEMQLIATTVQWVAMRIAMSIGNVLISLVPQLAGVAAGIGTTGTVSAGAAIPMLAVGAAAVGIGAGVWLAVDALVRLMKLLDDHSALTWLWTIFKAIGDVIQGVVDAVKWLINAIRDLVNSAKDLANTIGNVVGGASDVVNVAFPFLNPTHWFATGGQMVTNGPTPIMVGEHGSERVTIEPAGTFSGNAGGGGNTVIFGGPVLFDQVTARKFARMQHGLMSRENARYGFA